MIRPGRGLKPSSPIVIWADTSDLLVLPKPGGRFSCDFCLRYCLFCTELQVLPLFILFFLMQVTVCVCRASQPSNNLRVYRAVSRDEPCFYLQERRTSIQKLVFLFLARAMHIMNSVRINLILTEFRQCIRMLCFILLHIY